ncbi:trypsin [Drosophila innubila]|uniref:trypsin n=1 Tax=Drosophila innubila TaxID=198719 RepID=UPI00148DC461|nr:trypsin [Drosophila innubila]
MRCRWLYLIFLILLLDQLAKSAGQRTRNARRSNGNQVQSRIAGGSNNNSPGRVRGSTALRRPQARIVSGNSRRRNRGTRRLNRRNRRNQRSNNRRSSANGVSSRIVSNSGQGRISQGPSASISTMPHLVQVHRGSESFCGGSLISSLWVLSAAHCVFGYTASDFYVIAGTSRLNGTDGVLRTVSYLAVTPLFTSRTMNMDASLLKLSSEMTGTNIGTIALAQRMPRPGTQVRIAGWGATREGGNAVTNLRSVRVTVIRQRLCRIQYRDQATITKYMFCAGGESGDSCSGDSGGSAVYNNRLFGITSFGMGCARANYAGVYTRVESIREWIANTMANN